MSLLSQFPVVLEWPVQWGDQDAFGHVNNTIFARWFETGRIAYMEKLGIPLRSSGLGAILASLTCHYRRQIKYPDRVLIGARVTRLGNSSLTMEHAVASESQQHIAAEGDSVIVIFDYTAQRSQRIPEEMRSRIKDLEAIVGNMVLEPTS